MNKLSLFLNRSARRQLEAMRPRLKRLAQSWCHDPHLADDLAQEALMRALHRVEQLRDEGALEGWLFAILNNCWRDHLRGRKEFVQIEDLDEAIFRHDTTPEQLLATRQTAHRVRQAMDRLPMGQRQILTLIDLEECSYAQVAAILNIPVGTVMSRLYRARQALKSDLQREEICSTKPNIRRVK